MTQIHEGLLETVHWHEVELDWMLVQSLKKNPINNNGLYEQTDRQTTPGYHQLDGVIIKVKVIIRKKSQNSLNRCQYSEIEVKLLS